MNMGDAIRRNALKFPRKLAVQNERKQLNYAELNTRVNSLANSLLGIGLKKGDNIAVLLGNCTEHIEVLFAAAKSGLVGVPIDPKWRGQEIATAIKFFDIAAIVLERAAGPALADALSRVEFKGPVLWVGSHSDDGSAMVREHAYEDLAARGNSREPDVQVASTDLFLIMITSGTTAFPKGCLSTHERYVLTCMNHGLGGRGFSSEDIELLVSPLCFNSGRSSALGHLFWGASVILNERFDPINTLETIQDERVTYIALAPVMADRLLEVPNLNHYDISSLRHLRKVGSPLHPRTVKGLIQRLTPNVFQSYASTDAGTVSLLLPEDQIRKSGSAGKLIWAAEAVISDEAGNSLPTGEVGEIICRGPLVCAGYYKNPRANEASFRDGWFLTGDLGRFDEEGFLYVVGRNKNMIKSGSISISPEEVQDVLQSHPKVREAAVVGVPHEVWGEAVLAVISLAAGQTATERELMNYCRSRTASYKVPKAIHFLRELPHTELGKVATKVIRSRFLQTFTRGDPPDMSSHTTSAEGKEQS